MSFSWACIGEFTLPAERIEAMKENYVPYVTPLESIRDDGSLLDILYDGTRVEYRCVFEKSMYADTVEAIQDFMQTVIDHGGTGKATIVGFDDGGPDAGDVFEIEDGDIAESDFGSDETAEAVRATPAYAYIRERFASAFKT